MNYDGSDTPSIHNQFIISQFTKQAVPYSKKHNLSNENELRQIVEITSGNINDKVLDLACGSGIVSCAFAKVTNHVTGIDLTPAMLAQAKKLQKQKGLSNIVWRIGDITKRLPFDNNSFSIVITRYSFHHLLDPLPVLREMKRVCNSENHGRVAIVDIALDPMKVKAFNQMEKIRDPSHVRALTFDELKSMMEEEGLTNIRTGHYEVSHQLNEHLQTSFPENPEDIEKIHKIFSEDIGKDNLGLKIRCDAPNSVQFFTPIVIIVGEKYSPS